MDEKIIYTQINICYFYRAIKYKILYYRPINNNLHEKLVF